MVHVLRSINDIGKDNLRSVFFVINAYPVDLLQHQQSLRTRCRQFKCTGYVVSRNDHVVRHPQRLTTDARVPEHSAHIGDLTKDWHRVHRSAFDNLNCIIEHNSLAIDRFHSAQILRHVKVDLRKLPVLFDLAVHQQQLNLQTSFQVSLRQLLRLPIEFALMELSKSGSSADACNVSQYNSVDGVNVEHPLPMSVKNRPMSCGRSIKLILFPE